MVSLLGKQARAKGGYEGDLDMDAELQRLDRRQNAAMAVRGDRMGPGASVSDQLRLHGWRLEHRWGESDSVARRVPLLPCLVRAAHCRDSWLMLVHTLVIE